MMTNLFRTSTSPYPVSPGFNAPMARSLAWGHGLFARAVNGLVEAGQRRAERQVSRFIESHGGELTDALEREISRRFGSPVGEVR